MFVQEYTSLFYQLALRAEFKQDDEIMVAMYRQGL